MTTRGGGRRRRERRPGVDAAESRGADAPRPSAAGATESGGAEGGARLPGWLPPAVYLALTLVLFREFVFTDSMLYGSDTLGLGYMARAFFAEALRTTGFPLSNPLLLGGTPFIDSLAGGDSLYPPSLLLLLVTETYRAIGWKLVLHVFLAGCFMHLWLRALDVSRGAALVGGVAYMLTPTFVTLVFPGHDGKMFVTALAPLLFWATERVFRRRGWMPLAAVGAIVALVILTTHFQMAYFLFGAVGAYAIFRALGGVGEAGRGGGVRGYALARLALFIAFAVIGAGAAAIQLVPAVAYVTDHSRRTMTTTEESDPAARVEYSSSWSLHPEEALSLVVPEFVGNSAADAEWAEGTYWGRNAIKLNHEYLGVVAVALAVLSFLGAPRRGLRWFLTAMGGIAFLFALGAHTPVWRVAYELLPGISLFRAPSMAVFLTAFSVSTLAALGVDRGFELTDERSPVSGRDLRWGGPLVRALGGVTAALGLGLVLAASGVLLSGWTAVVAPDLDARQMEALARLRPFIVRGFFLATLFAAATLAIWWAHGRGWLARVAVVGLLAALAAADELRVDSAFVRTIDPAAFLEPDSNVRFLIDRSAEEPPFRVFSMVGSGQDVAPAMYGIELAAGHHPNDLGRYRSLIGMEGSGIPENLAFFHPNVMRILNVQYVLWPDAQYRWPFTPTDSTAGVSPVSRTVIGGGQPYESVYPYPGLPRARLVGEAVVVPDDRTLAVVLGEEGSYDPERQTVLSEPPPIDLPGGDIVGTVTWIERTPDRLVLQVDASGPAMLVISENWFPAWRATIDGEPASVLRADHTLRALAVSAGSHRIEMWYESSLLEASAGVSATCVVLLGLAGAGGALRARRDRRRASAPS